MNENFNDQNELISKFLEEYHSTQKLNHQLEETIQNLKNQFEIELKREKDSNNKIIQEHKKNQKVVKDMKLEIQNYQAQLMSKDNEIKDLKRRLELKSIIDDKLKDRDNNMFVKFLGRKPVSTNSQDQKLLNILNHYESQREKLENECQNYQKELKKIMDSQLKNEQQVQQQEQFELSNKLQLQKNNEQLLNQTMQYKKEIDQYKIEFEKTKRENAKLMEQSQFVITQCEEFKRLYNDTRKELIDSFAIITSLKQQRNEQPPRILACTEVQGREQSQSYKTGTFENGDDDKLCEQSFSQRRLQMENKENNQNAFNKIKDKNTLNHLMEIFSVDNEEQLIQACEKIELVMLGVQKLEQFCRQICDIVLVENNTNDFENVLPTIKKWKNEIRYIEGFLVFKKQLEQLLEIDNATDQIILQAVSNLKDQQSSKKSGDISLEVKKMFNIQNDENVMIRLNQICIQLSDVQKFIKFARKLLEFDENMRNDACLTYILKLLEKMKLQSFNDPDLIWKIIRYLHIEHPNQILPTLEQIMRNK